METTNAQAWLHLISLGAIVGAGGQGIRITVGLKKLSDAANTQADHGALFSHSTLFDIHRCALSLLIGAIAGGIAAALTVTGQNVGAISGLTLAGIGAAGYSGADFIEGVMTRATPATLKIGPLAPQFGNSQGVAGVSVVDSDNAVG